jgi:hypothetical protein
VTYVSEEETRVRRPCRIHPQLLAVVDMHNLRRDEHLELCVGCFFTWLGRVSIEQGVTNAMSEAYDEIKPFASEIAAEWAAKKRDRKEVSKQA